MTDQPTTQEAAEPQSDAAKMLAVAICTMPNPPSWNEAVRIADWLVSQRMVR